MLTGGHQDSCVKDYGIPNKWPINPTTRTYGSTVTLSVGLFHSIST